MKEKQVKKKAKANKNKNYKLRRILAIVILIVILIGIITLILLSDLFKIKKITVINNSENPRVDTNTIIESSKLTIGNNMFKTLKRTIKNGVKSNPYINNVKVKRKLNGEIIIEVEERTAAFMLKRESDYVYINNQGYILECNTEAISVPIIIGYATQDLTPGNRLDNQDLKKLEQAIQIIENAKSNGISEMIYSIDIANANNYILDIPSETKKVQFGDNSNINVKMLWIVELIEKEKGVDGEIILNVPNIKKVYFRERV